MMKAIEADRLSNKIVGSCSIKKLHCIIITKTISVDKGTIRPAIKAALRFYAIDNYAEYSDRIKLGNGSIIEFALGDYINKDKFRGVIFDAGFIDKECFELPGFIEVYNDCIAPMILCNKGTIEVINK